MIYVYKKVAENSTDPYLFIYDSWSEQNSTLWQDSECSYTYTFHLNDTEDHTLSA